MRLPGDVVYCTMSDYLVMYIYVCMCEYGIQRDMYVDLCIWTKTMFCNFVRLSRVDTLIG